MNCSKDAMKSMYPGAWTTVLSVENKLSCFKRLGLCERFCFSEGQVIKFDLGVNKRSSFVFILQLQVMPVDPF